MRNVGENDRLLGGDQCLKRCARHQVKPVPLIIQLVLVFLIAVAMPLAANVLEPVVPAPARTSVSDVIAIVMTPALVSLMNVIAVPTG